MKKGNMHLLDGKRLATQVREQLKKDIQSSGITPGLAAVLVGDDPASHLYVNLKEKAAAEVGMYFERIELAANIDHDVIINTIGELNGRDDIHGILVQLPLPSHIDTDTIIRSINPDKDADGFHPENINLIHEGKTKIMSPPHAGIMAFLDETGTDLKGKKAVLLANSHEFGDPLNDLLSHEGMNVTTLVKEDDFSAHTKDTDVLVAAVGKANLIQAEDIKKDAIVIDVGTNKVDGKLYGDVDFESVKDKVSWITPVPGGVGPMTVAFLLRNTFELASRLQQNSN